MAETPHRMTIPRHTVVYTFEASCFIDPSFVKSWEEHTEAQQDKFEQHGPIPCDGGFLPGIWCEDCRFGERSPMEEES